MLGLIAVVLIVLWLLGFLAFHISSGLIHILLVVGLIMLVFHFLRGSPRTAGVVSPRKGQPCSSVANIPANSTETGVGLYTPIFVRSAAENGWRCNWRVTSG